MSFWRKSHRLSISEKHLANGVTQGSGLVTVQPGYLNLKEDAAGGLGRHLGLFSTTFLMLAHSLLAARE